MPVMRALLLAVALAEIRLNGPDGTRSRPAGRTLLQSKVVSQVATAATAAAASGVTRQSAQLRGRTESRSTSSTGLFGKQTPGIYIPKIGIGNVTTPTLLPPPPPVLDPVQDYQPLDTAIGDFVLKQFVEPPTVTPPPLQSQLDLANACPIMLPAPDIMFVRAPKLCGSTKRSGLWRTATEQTLMVWNESSYSTAGVDVSFTNPIGDSFGFVKQEFRLQGTKVDFLDCGLNVLWTMTEDIFLDKSKKDPEKCATYGICDGSIFLKYTITKNGDPGTGAKSALVPIFAREFDLYDIASQNKVLTASKATAWSSRTQCPDYEKEWSLTFFPGNGLLADPGQRWVLAYMVTAMSIRDEDRSNGGKVLMNTTQGMTWLIIAGMILGGGILVSLLAWLFDKHCRAPMTQFCFKIEASFFPATMYKNKFYA